MKWRVPVIVTRRTEIEYFVEVEANSADDAAEAANEADESTYTNKRVIEDSMESFEVCNLAIREVTQPSDRLPLSPAADIDSQEIE